MVFTQSQRLVLFTGWKHGYLSDVENYGLFSEHTGLSRKQISNYARGQINKLGNQPAPLKSTTPLSSILKDLYRKKKIKRHRAPEDKSANVSPFIAALRPKTKKRARIRFTENQRKVLSISWERGFLCDNKHYGSISIITGLTRKQISNWARERVRKCVKIYLPPKNSAPIETIFNELSECIRPCSERTASRCNPWALQLSSYNQGQSTQDIAIRPWNYYQSFANNTFRSANGNCLPPQFLQSNFFPANDRTRVNRVQSRSDYTSKYPGNNVALQSASAIGLFEICSVGNDGAFHQFGQQTDTDLPINTFVSQMALQRINTLNDMELENIALSTATKHDELIWWLLSHGWKTAPAEQGMRYERIVTAHG